ncbi:hypothetical protein [Ralstonia solanacearum]|uniref:hypothetical protein n=1 Tax=Ralstonia solanacearum TaxID=305 RepID=UPI00078E20BB|nr:hypothetical protein [Ralstonia solanacearum]AMP39823.1 hypothetical protein LBM2029_19770 [Ralstonia solanacearum]AXV88666.1 hypothetical protein CJO78_20345 [Ralstonia solanacearum]AXW08138.1 hypothetical protein CJO82_20005 [Ralstonia solanacearum]AXW25929.1 hypothetical protein CJO86_20270 [Ralstonia solanacearum]AXW82839.1 hypothetical protein CJO98_20365 [Ralstonia solanacearum]
MTHPFRIFPRTPPPAQSPSSSTAPTSSDTAPAPAGKAPRKRGILSLPARLLPKASETELSTLVGASKYSGRPVDTAAAYSPPARTVSAPPDLPTSAEREQASRSRANTSGLVQRAQRGLQKLQGTRHSRAPKPDVSSTRLPVTVPDSEPRYRQLLAQGFAATQDARAVGSLADRLRALAPPLAEEAGERPRYARPMLVAKVLEHTCGQDAAAALRVLDRLTGGMRLGARSFAGTPEGSRHDPGAREPALTRQASNASDASDDFFDALSELDDAAPAQDAGAAWRTAQLLARYHAGFDALCNLMRIPNVPEQRQAAHAFLQAADALQHGSVKPVDSPQGLLDKHPIGSGAPEERLAIKTLHGAAAVLRGETPTPEQAGALFAWHQGFRQEGPGTDLDKTKARIGRFVGRIIPRVEKQSWRTMLWQMIGKKASPLSSARLGMQAAHRKNLAGEYKDYVDALRNAVNKLNTQYVQAEAGAAGSPTSLPWNSPQEMWHSAILKHWAAALAEASPKDCVLTDATLGAIGRQLSDTVTKVFDALAAGIPQATEHDDGLREHLRASLSRLTHLSAGAGLPLKPGSPVRPQPGLEGLAPSGALLRSWSLDPPGESLEKALKAAEGIEQQDDLKLQEKTIEAARELIESLLTTIDAGGKLRLASGSTLGLNTGTLSTGLQNAGNALVIPVSVQADIHATRKRQAVVEFGRGAHGRDLFIGTDKTVRAAAGFGAAFGYDFKVLANRIRASLGLSVVPIDAEKGKRVGVMFRAVRQLDRTQQPVGGYHDWEAVKYDDTATRQALINLSNWLFEQATEHRQRQFGHEEVWNALAQHCGTGNAISVGWVDQRKQRLRHKVRLSGGVHARISNKGTPIRIGPSARLTAEKTSRDATATRETAGIMRVEQSAQGHGGHLTLRAGLTYSAGKMFFTSSAPDAATGSDTTGGRSRITQGFNGGTPLAWSKQFVEHGHTVEVRTIHLNGRLADRVCYFDKRYKSNTEFLALIRTRQRVWIDMLARKPGGTREAAEQEFKVFCDMVEKHTGPNIGYLYRERLKPAIAREIEGQLDLADMHRALDIDALADLPAASGDTAPPPEPATGGTSHPQPAAPTEPIAPRRRPADPERDIVEIEAEASHPASAASSAASSPTPSAPETVPLLPPAPHKTSRLPAKARNFLDKFTAKAQTAQAAGLSDTKLNTLLTGNAMTKGRSIRAVQREVDKRIREGNWNPAGRPQVSAPAGYAPLPGAPVEAAASGRNRSTAPRASASPPPPARTQSAELTRRDSQAAALAAAETNAQACEVAADAALFDETSWLPERLAIVENISRKEAKGLSTTLQLHGTSEATGQRDLHNLKFG